MKECCEMCKKKFDGKEVKHRGRYSSSEMELDLCTECDEIERKQFFETADEIADYGFDYPWE